MKWQIWGMHVWLDCPRGVFLIQVEQDYECTSYIWQLFCCSHISLFVLQLCNFWEVALLIKWELHLLKSYTLAPSSRRHQKTAKSKVDFPPILINVLFLEIKYHRLSKSNPAPHHPPKCRFCILRPWSQKLAMLEKSQKLILVECTCSTVQPLHHSHVHHGEHRHH